jgi:F-type H+-transporting ATPase subunit delta
VASASSSTSGVAGRYATAVFEIAKDARSLDKVESDLGVLEGALEESADLRDLLASPVYSRDEQARAVGALAQRLELGTELTNTVGLMAEKRRLFVLPTFIARLKALIAADRGEVEAEVTTAKALTKEQTEALASTLRASVGSDIRLDVKVDPDLIGGMVVKVGSRMIDTSIRSKLAQLQNVMKEVG